LPLLKITDPVGIGLPAPALRAMKTAKDCAVLMLEEDGVTTTVGAVNVEDMFIVYVADATRLVE
jgi:hypothetical protein